MRPDTDIYIVDTYGEVNQFYNLSNLSFVGGSLIKHGGQNPLEPARGKNYIIHGPYINNFKEVYNQLLKLKIASKINNIFMMNKFIEKKINYKLPQKINNKLSSIGKNILKNNIYEINRFLK